MLALFTEIVSSQFLQKVLSLEDGSTVRYTLYLPWQKKASLGRARGGGYAGDMITQSKKDDVANKKPNTTFFRARINVNYQLLNKLFSVRFLRLIIFILFPSPCFS